MASTWSALKIELLETGANSGTWGTATNVNLGDALLGEAITGSATVDFASAADVTVTLTDSATSQSARNLRLNITESSTGVGYVGNLILGSGCQIEKFYLIKNNGTGAKTIKNTSGTGISVPAGKSTLVYNDGTNVVDGASYFTSLTLGSALPVASGGTGLTAGTSGGVLAYTASGTLASSTALAASALVIGGGAGAAPSTTTTGTGVVTALGVNTGSAGAFVVNGGALGSPSSVGTMPAFTLGGTVAGGGNQLNNVIIGTSTPLAGAFTSVTASTTLGVTGVSTFSAGTAALPALTTSGDTNTGIFFPAADTVATSVGGTEGMRLTSTGLGIGTSSPTQKLQVNGTGRFYKASVSTIGAVASSGLLIDGAGTNGNLSQIGIGYDSSLTYMPAAIYGITTTQSANTAMAIGFATRDVTTDTQPTERVRITQAGDVGIGTSSPTTKLTLSGSSTIITLDGTTSTGARGLDFVYSSQSYGSLLNYAQTGETALTAGYTGSSGYFLTFKTENVERVRITNAGDVGIGKSSPSAKLDVGATSDVGFALSNSSSVTSGNRGNIYMLNSSLSTVGLIRFGAVTDNVGTEIQFHTRPAAGVLTEFLRIASTGAFGLSGANYGTNGQVLTSGGASAAPTWTTISGGSQWTTSGSDIYYSTGGISVGTTSVPAAMYSSSPFGTAVPKQLVYKDTSSGGSALLNIEGSISASAATRISGINFALSTQANAQESNKSGSVYVKATDGYANTPSLYIASGNIDSISILASTGVPTFLQGLVIPSGKTVSGAGSISIVGTAISRFENTSGSQVIVTNSSADGSLIVFDRGGSGVGSISVSAGTVSYNAFAGSHWSQLHDGTKPTILRGTVLEAIDELVTWPNEPTTERLCKVKVSDTAASKKVYGVFMAWDEQWTPTNDMYVTAVGAFVCRVAANQTVQVGDLLESNGDGTARVQTDDLIRSSTIGKVTTTVKTHEYGDGTYCVPTVLYCG